jgi:hypothetical protein
MKAAVSLRVQCATGTLPSKKSKQVLKKRQASLLRIRRMIWAIDTHDDVVGGLSL